MEQELIKVLEEHLNPTNFDIDDNDEENFILNNEEVYDIIEYEVSRLRSHHTWKMKQTEMLSEGEILKRLSETNYHEKLDKEQILLKANSRKHYDLWQKEQRIKEKEFEKKQQEELQAKWNANKIYQLMAWTSKKEYGKDFIMHDDNRTLIKTVCYFISNDERFETELGFSFKKGLLIRGVSGLGKTHIVKCAEHNEINPILILSMIEIAEEVKTEGEFNINMRDKKIIYLDDVGTEETVINHFGTKINFFKNFIETIYLRNKNFNKLIISTNVNFAGIEQLYGFRVRSRMEEMFNVIDVKGKDMRKQ